MSKKVLAVALSVNKKTLLTHFLRTWDLMMKDTQGISDYELHGVVFVQGFEVTGQGCPGLDIIRDDSHYNRGYTISEIRDYFYELVLKEYSPDYILHCDDDFKFTGVSRSQLDRDVKYMEDYPDAGVICMYHYNKPEIYDISPSQVATRSGVLIRRDAFVTWGGSLKVKYFEECVMAVYAYQKGYRIVHSTSSTVHNTKPTGLGRSLELQYGENNIPNNGRKIMCDEGLLLPIIGKDKSVRYDREVMNHSRRLEQDHDYNNDKLFQVAWEES